MGLFLLVFFFFSIKKKSFIHSQLRRPLASTRLSGPISRSTGPVCVSAEARPPLLARVQRPQPRAGAARSGRASAATSKQHRETRARRGRQQPPITTSTQTLLGSVLPKGQIFSFSKASALLAPLSPPVPVLLNAHCRGFGGLLYNTAWLPLTQKGRSYHVEL